MSECRPGDILDVWDGGAIVSAVVLAEEKGRICAVTERGDEIRIPASRIAHRAGRAPAADPRAAAAAAARHAGAAGRIAQEIDAGSLWEILVDAGGRHSAGDLAALAVGASSAEAASGLIRRLTAEKTYFERKGDVWEARSRDAVEETRRRERTIAEKERRREALLVRVRERLDHVRPGERGPGAEGPEPPALGPDEGPFLAMLADLAVRGDEARESKEAVSLLDDLGVSGATPALAAFDLLVRVGIFSQDENLEIRRYGLKTSFPDEVERAARAAAERPLGGESRDLTSLTAFTVDDADTVEIDDALSWEERGGGAGVVGVHIADPASIIAPGDVVDEEALVRAVTYYFADRRLPMLPAVISEDAASLLPGRTRLALSFLVTVDSSGRVTEWEIAASRIRSSARLTYDEADAFIGDTVEAQPEERAGEDRGRVAEALRALHGLASSLEAERAAAGAVMIRAPEIDVRAAADGTVRLKRIEARGPSRRLVAEFMILANRLGARFCMERNIPAIYRRQPAPEKKPAPIPEGPYDPVAIRAVRRSLRRGEVCLSPDAHYALGLPAYLQVTSPLRRYQDLAVQRQIKAFLAGEALPYDAAGVTRIAATTEVAERAARQAEAAVDAYWILKFLDARSSRTIEGVILATEPRRTEVELSETLTSASIAPRPDHVPGARVRLVIETVRPREGVLRLREVDATA